VSAQSRLRSECSSSRSTDSSVGLVLGCRPPAMDPRLYVRCQGESDPPAFVVGA